MLRSSLVTCVYTCKLACGHFFCHRSLHLAHGLAWTQDCNQGQRLMVTPPGSNVLNSSEFARGYLVHRLQQAGLQKPVNLARWLV